MEAKTPNINLSMSESTSKKRKRREMSKSNNAGVFHQFGIKNIVKKRKLDEEGNEIIMNEVPPAKELIVSSHILMMCVQLKEDQKKYLQEQEKTYADLVKNNMVFFDNMKNADYAAKL